MSVLRCDICTEDFKDVDDYTHHQWGGVCRLKNDLAWAMTFIKENFKNQTLPDRFFEINFHYSFLSGLNS